MPKTRSNPSQLPEFQPAGRKRGAAQKKPKPYTLDLSRWEPAISAEAPCHEGRGQCLFSIFRQAGQSKTWHQPLMLAKLLGGLICRAGGNAAGCSKQSQRLNRALTGAASGTSTHNNVTYPTSSRQGSLSAMFAAIRSMLRALHPSWTPMAA